MTGCMKTFLLFILFPLQLFAQPGSREKDITGLWKGTVITPELNLPYELIITRKNGVLSGYSHTTFTVRGEEIVSVKKVIVRFKDDKIIVEDEDMLFNNFKEEAPKKIKQTNKLTLEESGKVWKLYGTFEAKALRMLKPAEGTIELEKKESPADTKLFAKLEELNLASSISLTFANEDPKAPLIAAVDKVTPGQTVTSPAINNYSKQLVVPKDSVEPVKTAIAQTTVSPAGENNKAVAPAKTENPETIIAVPVVLNISKKPGMVTQRIPTSKRPVYAPTLAKTTAKIAPLETQAPVIAKTTAPVVPDKSIAKNPLPSTEMNKPTAAVVRQPVTKAVAATKPAVTIPKPPTAAVAKVSTIAKPTPVNVIVAPALDLAKRQIETIQQLYIESDSLQFTLYDNGEVDGDTVSVALNGKTIVSRQGLNTTAFTKTVYITPDLGDSVQLIMFAENLGSLPPNTGLLVLQYDNKRQEIRFSGDLNKNAAITLRRKPKE
jgi:hypothetical protein